MSLKVFNRPERSGASVNSAGSMSHRDAARLTARHCWSYSPASDRCSDPRSLAQRCPALQRVFGRVVVGNRLHAQAGDSAGRQSRHKCESLCCRQPKRLQCPISELDRHDAGGQALSRGEWIRRNIEIVRPGQLSQFIARMNAAPSQPKVAGQSYQVTPPGNRPWITA